MPVRKYKPTSPGRRFMSVSTFEEITKTEPEKSLTEPLKKSGGRNGTAASPGATRAAGTSASTGSSTSSALKDGVPAKVAAIEYDPNRSARIALLHYADGAKAYILAPARLQVGALVESGPGADIKPGNALPLQNIPTGTLVHNVELKPGRGGQLARSAGSGVQLVAKDEGYGRASATIGRAAPRAAHVPGDDRSGRQRRPREHHRRQGGAQPLEGQAPDGARLCDEPGRPSARRRRGQVEGRTAPGHARGACPRSASARAASTRNPTS